MAGHVNASDVKRRHETVDVIRLNGGRESEDSKSLRLRAVVQAKSDKLVYGFRPRDVGNHFPRFYE